MFINITIQSGGNKLDIRIDSEQKIKNALSVLRQSGKLPPGKTLDYFRSMLNQNLVSVHKTFAEEDIFDGDKLVAITGG